MQAIQTNLIVTVVEVTYKKVKYNKMELTFATKQQGIPNPDVPTVFLYNIKLISKI